MIKRWFNRYFHDVLIAVEAIFANKLKSLLTALGIIFGVAAVISMLAIGNGAQQEILDQIKLVGVNNIIIRPTMQSINANGEQESGEGRKGGVDKFSRGLTLRDVDAIKKVVPSVKMISPVVTLNYSAIKDGKSKPVVLEGITSSYFELFNLPVTLGKKFSKVQNEKGLPVCVIGHNVKTQFFQQNNPIGKYIKCGPIWLKVVGVIQKRNLESAASDEMGISSSENKIYIPIKSMLMRFKNRSLIRADEVELASAEADKGDKNNGQTSESSTGGNRNQLDQIIVQVEEPEQLNATAAIINRLMLRRHSDVYDFEVTVPELLLKQQQKTKNIFNIVLGAIAGISLIVGGIGIMNIMLASVWERIREIGTRQALGASRKDIIVQFLAESTLISVTGGILGIMLGVALARIIEVGFDIKTIVSAFSIIVAFGVSVFVGIVFGYMPAKRAAEQDPVVSLRQ